MTPMPWLLGLIIIPMIRQSCPSAAVWAAVKIWSTPASPGRWDVAVMNNGQLSLWLRIRSRRLLSYSRPLRPARRCCYSGTRCHSGSCHYASSGKSGRSGNAGSGCDDGHASRSGWRYGSLDSNFGTADGDPGKLAQNQSQAARPTAVAHGDDISRMSRKIIGPMLM